MILGVPKEVKTHEYRVGLTPTSVREVVAAGHQIVVETNAGAGIGAADSAYEKAGARIGDPWKEAELIVKVKEPQPAERKKIAERHVLFTYFHLAPDRAQTEDLVKSGAICRVRATEYISASTKSCDRPPAPCAWIARSSTQVATAGAATFSAEISIRAPRLPIVSISQAVLSVSRRTCSIRIRASAIQCWTTP